MSHLPLSQINILPVNRFSISVRCLNTSPITGSIQRCCVAVILVRVSLLQDRTSWFLHMRNFLLFSGNIRRLTYSWFLCFHYKSLVSPNCFVFYVNIIISLIQLLYNYSFFHFLFGGIGLTLTVSPGNSSFLGFALRSQFYLMFFRVLAIFSESFLV